MSIQTAPETDQAAGVIPAAPWRVKTLSVLPDYRLAVTFMDDTNGIVDFSSILTARNAESLNPPTSKVSFHPEFRVSTFMLHQELISCDAHLLARY